MAIDSPRVETSIAPFAATSRTTIDVAHTQPSATARPLTTSELTLETAPMCPLNRVKIPVEQRGPRLAAAPASWPAAQLGR
jgi:hypothetical protein